MKLRVCYILDALNYQYKIDHMHALMHTRMGKGRQRYAEFTCMWCHKSRTLSTNGDHGRREELLPLDMDMPHCIVYIALGCLGG